MASFRRYMSTRDLIDDWRYWRARAKSEGPGNNAWVKSYQHAYWSWAFLTERWGVSMDIDRDLQQIIEGRTNE